jgi:hypothetical protein
MTSKLGRGWENGETVHSIQGCKAKSTLAKSAPDTGHVGWAFPRSVKNKAKGNTKMRGIGIFVFILALTCLVGVFGFAEIFGPIARAAVVWIPAIFTVCLLIGFASRRRMWF